MRTAKEERARTGKSEHIVKANKSYKATVASILPASRL